MRPPRDFNYDDDLLDHEYDEDDYRPYRDIYEHGWYDPFEDEDDEDEDGDLDW